MPFKIPTPHVLDPAIVGLGATVECRTYVPIFPSSPFFQVVYETRGLDESTFYFGGTTFRIHLGNRRRVTRISTTVKLGEKMPQAFVRGDLALSYVAVDCEVPQAIVARPGVYDGKELGFATGVCVVDPTGDITSGQPTVFAASTDRHQLTNLHIYDAVTSLFIGVMDGTVVNDTDND